METQETKKSLERNGFKVVKFYGNVGSEFVKNKSISIFIVAKKI